MSSNVYIYRMGVRLAVWVDRLLAYESASPDSSPTHSKNVSGYNLTPINTHSHVTHEHKYIHRKST